MWAFRVTGAESSELLVAIGRAAPAALSRTGNAVAVSSLLLMLGYEQSILEQSGLFDDVALAAARRVAEFDAREAGDFVLRLLNSGQRLAAAQEGPGT